MKQMVIELAQDELKNIYGGEVRWILLNGKLIPVETKSN